jgi:plastocyanin
MLQKIIFCKGRRKMLKKQLGILVLLLGLVFIVSACGDDKETSGKSSENADSPAKTSLLVSGDVVEEKAGCVLKSQFTVGDLIVWRVDVTDPETMKQAADDTKVQVHLSTGEVLDMHYGAHPAGEENAPEFWTVSLPVTEDTPTGVLEYYVTAEKGDKKGEFHPFDVAPSLLTINPADGSAAAVEEESDSETEDTTNVETNQTINLVAKNFSFEGDNGATTFYVKAGEEVTLNLKLEEGTHGVMIPDLDVQLDKEGSVKFTPTEPGEYDLFCSIFCGDGHGKMTSKIVVVE